MRGLLIREPWITYILDGRKTWEIRGGNCRIRGRIGLIRSGSGLVVGTAEIVDSKGPLSDEEMRANVSKHCIPPEALDGIRKRYKNIYAWVLTNAKPLPKPLSYVHSKGAIKWVKIPDIPP